MNPLFTAIHVVNKLTIPTIFQNYHLRNPLYPHLLKVLIKKLIQILNIKNQQTQPSKRRDLLPIKNLGTLRFLI